MSPLTVHRPDAVPASPPPVLSRGLLIASGLAAVLGRDGRTHLVSDEPLSMMGTSVPVQSVS